MKSHPHLLAALAMATLFSSCLPRDRMWWSPDGAHAVVATGTGLVLADAEGRPMGQLPSPGPLSTVLDGTLAWSPDGGSLAMVVENRSLTWKEAMGKIPKEEAARVESLVKSLPHLLKVTSAGLTAGKPSLKDTLQGLAVAEERFLPVALRAAFEADPAQVAGWFSGWDKENEIMEALRGDDLAIVLYELRHQPMASGRAAGGASLRLASLLPLGQLAFSPDGKRLAFAREQGAQRTLEHLAVDGDWVPVTAGSYLGEPSFAWSPDSSSLVVARLFNKGMPLGRIEAVAVAAVTDDSSSRVLAEGILTEPPALAVLPDGSVLFAASPVVYPLAGAETRPEPAFHLVSPDGAKVTRVPTPPGSLPADLRFFSLSPDGRHVAIVESGTTTVATLELATGKVKLASQPSAGWKCRTRPAWRNAQEFTHAAEKAGEVGVMVHSLDRGSRPWGEGLAKEAFTDWLDKPDSK